MYIKYVCPVGRLIPHAAAGVVRLDIENQLPLLEAFFGVAMADGDRKHFLSAFKRGLQEDFVILEGGEIVARAVIMRFESGGAEIGCVVTRPPWRGRGYAKGIVGCCAARLHAQNQPAMGITTAENAPMRAVFEALGFVGTECAE